jgi:DNA polymerase-3 subunit alpha
MPTLYKSFYDVHRSNLAPGAGDIICDPHLGGYVKHMRARPEGWVGVQHGLGSVLIPTNEQDWKSCLRGSPAGAELKVGDAIVPPSFWTPARPLPEAYSESDRAQGIDVMHRLVSGGQPWSMRRGIRLYRGSAEIQEDPRWYRPTLDTTVKMPRFCDTPEEEAETLRQMVRDRWSRVLDSVPRGERGPYQERARFEMDVIIKMGFPGYFLVVGDMTDHMRREGIPTGYGRGSAAGSLICYVLGITDLDPIKFGLYFERFLNPGRKSLPDIDTDISSSRREGVLAYLRQRYGRDSVAQIGTFNYSRGRKAIRTAFGVFYPEQRPKKDASQEERAKLFSLNEKRAAYLGYLVSLVPPADEERGYNVPLKEAAERNPDLAEKLAGSKKIAELWGMACHLEGRPQGKGKHAGGVVITPGKLWDHGVPVRKTEEGWISDLAMDDVEYLGLIKLDVLGVSTIDALAKTGVPKPMSFDDPGVYHDLQHKKDTCLFQFTQTGAHRYLRQLGARSFSDLVALNALNRPGPKDAGWVEGWIGAQTGGEKGPLQAFFPETDGFIIYQEQVLTVAKTLMGYSLAEADDLRKVIGKKQREKMQEHKQRWVEAGHGELFEAIEGFAQYAFNLAHAAAYAGLSYWGALAKHQAPAAFFAAHAEHTGMDDDTIWVAPPGRTRKQPTDVKRIVRIVQSARNEGVMVLPPLPPKPRVLTGGGEGTPDYSAVETIVDTCTWRMASRWLHPSRNAVLRYLF